MPFKSKQARIVLSEECRLEVGLVYIRFVGVGPAVRFSGKPCEDGDCSGCHAILDLEDIWDRGRIGPFLDSDHLGGEEVIVKSV